MVKSLIVTPVVEASAFPLKHNLFVGLPCDYQKKADFYKRHVQRRIREISAAWLILDVTRLTGDPTMPKSHAGHCARGAVSVSPHPKLMPFWE